MERRPDGGRRAAAGAFLVLIALSAAACASAGGGPRPRPFPGAPEPPTAEAPQPVGPPVVAPPSPVAPDAIVSTAMMLRGIPYRNGGSSPSGFDCSGFVQWVFAQNGIRLPREVREQYEAGHKIDLHDVQPGDLLFFQTVSRGASHVGVAIGGDQFVHAPSSTGVVRVERYTVNYWTMRFVGARRIDSEASGPSDPRHTDSEGRLLSGPRRIDSEGRVLADPPDSRGASR